MCQKDKNSNKKWIRNVFLLLQALIRMQLTPGKLPGQPCSCACRSGCFSLLSPTSGAEEKTTPCFCKLAPQCKKRAVLIMSTALLQLLPALLRLTRDVRLKNTANAGPKPFYLQSNRRAAPGCCSPKGLRPQKRNRRHMRQDESDWLRPNGAEISQTGVNYSHMLSKSDV